METAVAMAIEGFVEDQRETCTCGTEIRWCTLKSKWFHIHNFMTFCAGGQKNPDGTDSAFAKPQRRLPPGV